jgi:hypothetical protein
MTLLRHIPFQSVLTLYGRETIQAVTELTSAVNSAVSFSFEALFPLFAFTSIESGGLGFSVRQARRTRL